MVHQRAKRLEGGIVKEIISSAWIKQREREYTRRIETLGGTVNCVNDQGIGRENKENTQTHHLRNISAGSPKGGDRQHTCPAGDEKYLDFVKHFNVHGIGSQLYEEQRIFFLRRSGV